MFLSSFLLLQTIDLSPSDLEQKEEINIHLEQKEETQIQKNEERLRNLGDNFKYSNIWIIGVPEGEEEQQDIENLFEKIMKENFPNLVMEIDTPRVPKKLDPQRNTQDTSELHYPRLRRRRES